MLVSIIMILLIMSIITTSVPQGTILDPLLYLISINDHLPIFNSKFNVLMFADDRTLYANLDDFTSPEIDISIN